MFGPHFEDYAINFWIESPNYSYNPSEIEDGLDPHIIANLQLSQKQFSRFFNRNNPSISTVIPPQITRLIANNHQNMPIDQNITADNLQKLIQNRVYKMVRNKRVKYKWVLQDIKILTWIVSNYCNISNINHTQLGEKDWEKISTMIPGAEPESTMFKWLSLIKDAKPKKWSQTEDKILEDLILKQDTSSGQYNWPQISKLLYKYNDSPQKIFRGPKQCRQHWNCINPSIKKRRWIQSQDVLLMKMVAESQTSNRWAPFSKKFEGRSQNALKNRFKLLISKEKKSLQESSNQKVFTQAQIITSFLAKHKNEVDALIQKQCLEMPFNKFLDQIQLEGNNKGLEEKENERNENLNKPENLNPLGKFEKKYSTEKPSYNQGFQKYPQSRSQLESQKIESKQAPMLSQSIQKQSLKPDFNSIDHHFPVSDPKTHIRTCNDLEKRNHYDLKNEPYCLYGQIEEANQLKNPRRNHRIGSFEFI